MRSFDFYDTLAVRMVASPADIFSLVGERLGISDFRSLRLEAESTARRAMGGGEVTLEQIYDYLPLGGGLKERARTLELDFERTLVSPVTAIFSQLRTGDLVISDMYLDEPLYREVLQRMAPDVFPRAVLISCVQGANKASGALWKKVANGYPELEWHIGDNFQADVMQARRNGVHAYHFGGSKLNRYEKTLAKQGLDGSLIAGASRAARLSLTRKETEPAQAATIEVFASVVCPLLHAFANWIIRTCDEAGIRSVYFLARDGQLPYRICSRLIQESGKDVHCRYIYASRHALHLPGCKTIDDAELWLLENTPHLSLRTIAERACVPLEVLTAVAKPHLTVEPDQNIPPLQRATLSRIIHSPSFVTAFMASVDRAYEPASDYYLAQGFTRGEDAALVDIGWNGRMQRSLGSLLEKSGNRPRKLLGLYLCLTNRLSNAPGDDLRGFLADPENQKLADEIYRRAAVLEAALSADHPTVRGFEHLEGAVCPIFGEPFSSSIQQRVALQHATFEAFVENIIALGRAAGRTINERPRSVLKNLMELLSRPRPEDGLSFVGFPIAAGQSGTSQRPVAKLLRASELLMPKRDFGYWPEGTLSASGFGAIVSLRYAIQRLARKRLNYLG